MWCLWYDVCEAYRESCIEKETMGRITQLQQFLKLMEDINSFDSEIPAIDFNVFKQTVP